MRFFYFILKITLGYAFFLYFKRSKLIRSPKDFFGSTIYVSNHPASFMDPLVVASFRNPIVFFMTRSDVFTPVTKPLLWLVHMLPIYRQQDGGDTKDLNKNTFRAATKVLASGRNLLIFGEGFTDDVFIRRLKPIKKGAARIGFDSLESLNWKKKIYIAAVGNNYTEPNTMRSEILIATSKKICLNDFKEEYLLNPQKVITEVTRLVENMMKEEITHIENEDWSEFHEQIMMITRKGMNASSVNKNLSLQKRWKYSQHLASWLNENQEASLDLQPLKDELSQYFKLLKKLKLKDEFVYQKQNQSGHISRVREIFKMIVLFPLAVLGFIHCAPAYFPVKRFVEKSFKRKVFWGSTKLVLAMFAMGIINIPYIFIFHAYIYDNWIVAFAYYWFIGVFGICTYEWFIAFRTFKEKGLVNSAKTNELELKREELSKEIKRLIPVA
jgi:hypothetical protein